VIKVRVVCLEIRNISNKMLATLLLKVCYISQNLPQEAKN